jgi:hypothetical protein
MINRNIEKHITEKVSQIQSLMTDKIWLQDKIKEINEFGPNISYKKTMSLETKIILQQTKIFIIESFWQYLLNKYKITSINLLFYTIDNKVSLIDISNFSNSKNIKSLLENFRISQDINDYDNKYDHILRIANNYWLDLIRKEIEMFDSIYLSNSKNGNQLFLMKELYTQLESYYLLESERESWVGNLEQEFAPLYRIYLRGINYNPKLITRESIEDFTDALYKCLRKEAANNTNNFIFSDTDFNNFTNKCPIHIKKESIENIKLQQINERYDSTILGCPAVFSKVDIKYKYGQLLKDIFYWQMDLYKEILLVID